MFALALLAGIIIGSIVSAAGFIWWISADSLTAKTLKRANKGRRHGDQ
jgi:hypothetical protein